MAKLQDAGTSGDWHRQQETEPGRCRTGETQQQSGRQCDPRPRDSRRQCEGLRTPDDHGEWQPYPLHPIPLKPSTVSHGQQDPTNDQQHCHHPRDTQCRFHHVLVDQPRDRRRHASRNDRKPEPPARCRRPPEPSATRREPGPYEVPPVTPEIDQQGEQGPHVQGDIKGLRMVGPSQQPRHDDQVTGTGNGQELSKALDNA